MQFPEYRPRRMRRNDGLRRMIRETRLSVDNFVYPMFVCPGRDTRRPIASMPGQAQLSVDQAVLEAKQCFDLGIPSVILFGVCLLYTSVLWLARIFLGDVADL